MYWDWSQLCGRGVDSFTVWSRNDFGHCFELLIFSCTAHAAFAVISAYYVGQHRPTVLPTAFLPRYWALHIRILCSVFLFLLPVLFAVLTKTYLDIQMSLIDIITVCICSVSWLIHTGFLVRLYFDCTRTLRGPGAVIMGFFLTFASQCIQVRTMVLQVTGHSKYLNRVEEYSCFVSFGLYVVYILTLIPLERVSFAQQQNLSIQDDEVSAESGALLGRRNRTTYGTQPIAQQPELCLGVAEDHANYLSKLFFCWVNPMMLKGSKGDLCSSSDLFLLPKALNTTSIEERFQSVIATYQGQTTEGLHTDRITRPETVNVEFRGHNQPRHSGLRQVTLIGALNKAFGWHYYSLGSLKLLADLLGFCGPILLNLLLSYMENSEEPVHNGYLYAGGLFLSTFLVAMLSTHFTYQIQVSLFNSMEINSYHDQRSGNKR